MENEYDLLKRHLRGTYVKREKFPLYYAPPCKKAASIKSCARRFPDRDFSLTGFIAPTKKKTLLERQTPQWCARRQAEKQHPPLAVQYDIGGQAQRVLSAWSKNFSNPARAEQLFVEMYAEKPKTALWYANHRANVFGECKTQPDIKLTEHNLAALQKVALAEVSITSHAYFHPDISSRERADTL